MEWLAFIVVPSILTISLLLLVTTRSSSNRLIILTIARLLYNIKFQQSEIVIDVKLLLLLRIDRIPGRQRNARFAWEVATGAFSPSSLSCFFFLPLSLSLFLPQGFSCDVTIPSSATHFFPFAFLSHRVADGTRVISSPSKGSGRPPVSIRQLATPTTLIGIYVRHYYIKNMSEMSLCTSDSSYLTVYRPSMSANVCALKWYRRVQHDRCFTQKCPIDSTESRECQRFNCLRLRASIANWNWETGIGNGLAQSVIFRLRIVTRSYDTSAKFVVAGLERVTFMQTPDHPFSRIGNTQSNLRFTLPTGTNPFLFWKRSEREREGRAGVRVGIAEAEEEASMRPSGRKAYWTWQGGQGSLCVEAPGAFVQSRSRPTVADTNIA